MPVSGCTQTVLGKRRNFRAISMSICASDTSFGRLTVRHIHHHTSTESIHQHTSAYVSIREQTLALGEYRGLVLRQADIVRLTVSLHACIRMSFIHVYECKHVNIRAYIHT